MDKLTTSQRKALGIIDMNPSILPREFAKKMWPNSEGWRMHSGHGSHTRRGGGMALAGGNYLGKLRKLDLIYEDYRPSIGDSFRRVHRLTSLGKELLNKARIEAMEAKRAY